MIEDLFPKTVGNILDYDAIKLAAKQYVEDVFVNIVQEFADNMTLYTMDAAHLADVAGHVAGDSSLSLEQLLDYINSENIYHECDFVSELLSAFPEGVEYKEFDVTGCGFPPSDLFPFNSENRSFLPNGTPMAMQDPLWGQNASGNLPERNLLMSRYKGQFDENDEPQWHRKEGRRSSWGNPATWMTSGGFGKPATIHINVDEERTVIEGNGLTAVENWLGTVSNKLPINLYIEIESHFVTSAEPASSSLEGYHMSFPYEEEEGFCTNDPNMSVSPNNATPPTPPPPPPPPLDDRTTFIVVDANTGEIVNSIIDEGMAYGDVGYVLMDEAGNMITVYETGVRTESFYFTTNGRNETVNTNISHADIPVYLEDGTAPAADTPYDGSSVLAFMDVTGNTKQADGESLYVDNGELRLDAPDTDEGEQWAALVEYIPEVVLKVKWGDTVNVPSGYKVSEVRTFVGYAFKSYYGDYSQWEQLATYEGKNEYFDNIDGHNLIITSTNSAADSAWPLIVASQGYQLNNTTGPHMQVLDFGAGYKNSTSYWGFSDVQTNGTDAQAGDFSVLLRGQASSTIINAINSGYPARFLWFIIDGEGNAVWHKTPEAFRVPNSLWSFVNGVFSWLGNSEDTSSLAWYYKHDWELFEWEEFDGVWFYVHCVYDPTPEPPAPTLPTVEKIGSQEGNYWLAFNGNGTAIDFGNGQTSPMYYNSGNYNYIQQTYDSTKLYAVIALQGSGVTIRNGINVENSSGNLLVRNSTGNSYSSLYGGYIAQCSDSTATVITVYKDSDGTAYNAFKYTASGTDYYYVLDKTQTDWTEDLESIGYSLEPPADYNLKVYGQNGDTISLSIENNFMYVFDESNNSYIMLNGGNSSTIWEIVSIIDTNGNEVSKESDYIWWINGSNIYYKASPTRPVTAAYILLKATPPIS